MVYAIWIVYTIWTVSTVMSRKEAQEQTRERVVAAAAKVFARRGYHRATVDEIASEAGFTIGALYSNFAGKEELFLAIADRQVEERVAEVGAIGDAAEGDDPGQDAAEQLRAFLERDPEWPLLFYEFWSLSVRNPELQGELAKRRDAIRDALAETLELVAKRHGFKLRFPAPVLATAIAASLNGLAFERAADPESLPDEVFAEFVTAVLGCAIAAP
jgi:AcrR family transcriptional regulator